MLSLEIEFSVVIPAYLSFTFDVVDVDASKHILVSLMALVVVHGIFLPQLGLSIRPLKSWYLCMG